MYRRTAGPVAWMLASTGIGMAATYAVLLGLARLGGPVALGEYAVLTAVLAPITCLCNMQLRDVLATDVDDRFSIGDYCMTRIVTSCVALAATAAAGFAAGAAPGLLLYAAAGAGRLCESLSDLVLGLAQRRSRYRELTRSLALRGTCGALAFLAAFAATRDLIWSVLAGSAISLLILAWHDLPLLRSILPGDAPRPGDVPWWRAVAAIVAHAAPLGLSTALVSLNYNVPRYVLAAKHGEAEVGMFAAMAILPAIGALLVSSAVQALVPALARARSRRDYIEFGQLCGLLLTAAAALGLGGLAIAWLAPVLVTTLLFGAEFAARAGSLPLVMACGLLTYLAGVISTLLMVTRRFGQQAAVVAATIALNALCGTALGWTALGFDGVIWGWFAAAAFQVLVGAWIVGRTLTAEVRQAAADGAAAAGTALAGRRW
jgi:O-antigen/teichoic acid export membrane protein